MPPTRPVERRAGMVSSVPGISRVRPATARAQAHWIAAIEPWRGLGYRAERLGAWLERAAATGDVLAAREGRAVLGIAALRRDVLLGNFVALLAVRPEAAGKGLGRRLMAAVEAETFARHRWLYVSHDARNRGAGQFYARLRFERVGRLPDLVAPGRTEVLLRKCRPARPTVCPGAPRRNR